MYLGHRPFNTPERFRGKSKAGLVGEMILEADEIVGRIMSELENQGIADDTLIGMIQKKTFNDLILFY